MKISEKITGHILVFMINMALKLFNKIFATRCVAEMVCDDDTTDAIFVFPSIKIIKGCDNFVI